MRSAWAWWWIIPCMKLTSASVYRSLGRFARSSAESVCDGSPGAPGCTMFGATSPVV